MLVDAGLWLSNVSLGLASFGCLEDAFYSPGSVECVQLVNKMVKLNWKAFVGEDFREMNGHLMRYPVKVSKNGKVSALPMYETFPDVGGKILGVPTTLPDALTT
ncbi:hypothetical protein SLEP1_g31225 [Rubroshorea leprosula]|uniref:Phospholipase D C-terminal domain-containing protein n=1 Tax=Rubroshorea leprosula TaxID=152421 RepID=A0AAV5KA73_9ROSI|nr:hypothetical protein SLEP1_g31225 [Rubroshorea leprosula]